MGDRWAQWCKNNLYPESFSRCGHVSQVWLRSQDGLFIVRNEDDVVSLARYAAPLHPKIAVQRIDWDRMADDFSGILFLDWDFMWGIRQGLLLGWDIPSLCLWDLSQVDRVTPVEPSCVPSVLD